MHSLELMIQSLLQKKSRPNKEYYIYLKLHYNKLSYLNFTMSCCYEWRKSHHYLLISHWGRWRHLILAIRLITLLRILLSHIWLLSHIRLLALWIVRTISLVMLLWRIIILLPIWLILWIRFVRGIWSLITLLIRDLFYIWIVLIIDHLFTSWIHGCLRLDNIYISIK